MDFLIVVEDLEVKYAPEIPPVLHGVLLSIESREKIGFLRRTRSGESTITMSILRLVDPTKGKIMIDGIDITKAGLHDLRCRIMFTPQDATLFSGTLRENIDPFNEHDNSECGTSSTVSRCLPKRSPTRNILRSCLRVNLLVMD
ncbi:hypothetical protein QCA50_019083 [Cerrena zonata]|uniref:ABC transporter domain-containing protein n=1 Tax=Cerrena zonata TaxID=2478898 RepID=A0AAW0FB90_9APHY